jgi:hypothetical protein
MPRVRPDGGGGGGGDTSPASSSPTGNRAESPLNSRGSQDPTAAAPAAAADGGNAFTAAFDSDDDGGGDGDGGMLARESSLTAAFGGGQAAAAEDTSGRCVPLSPQLGQFEPTCEAIAPPDPSARPRALHIGHRGRMSGCNRVGIGCRIGTGLCAAGQQPPRTNRACVQLNSLNSCQMCTESGETTPD